MGIKGRVALGIAGAAMVWAQRPAAADNDFLIGNVKSGAEQALIELGKIKTNDPGVADYYDGGFHCNKYVVAALAGGVPPTTMITYNFYEPVGIPKTMALSEVKAKICDVADAAEVISRKKGQAGDDEKYAPYLSVLSGDKKRLFREKNMLDGTDYAGPKGHRLKTPADFKGAASWYYWLHDRSGITPRWEVEGWQFKGDKLLRTYDKKGSGEDVPDSAFK